MKQEDLYHLDVDVVLDFMKEMEFVIDVLEDVLLAKVAQIIV